MHVYAEAVCVLAMGGMNRFHLIRLTRERVKLERLAREQGLDGIAGLLYDMYVVKGMSIEKIAKTLVTPIWSLRKMFDEFEIPVNLRGGPNAQKFDVTQELIEEVSKIGVSATAARLGLEPTTLYWRLRKYYQENHK